MEKNNKKIGHLPVDRQPKDRMYDMVLKFKGDVELLIPGIMPEQIPGVSLVAGNAVELTMSQVVNFIPDQATLERYAGILEEGYSKAAKDEGFRIRNVRFHRYERFMMAECPSPIETEPQPPFGVHVAYDGESLTVDDGIQEPEQVPCKPWEARSMAVQRLLTVMDHAQEAPDAGRIATRIEWDADDADAGLPSEVPVPDEVADGDIADWLSDEYGFLVEAYVLERQDNADTKEV